MYNDPFAYKYVDKEIEVLGKYIRGVIDALCKATNAGNIIYYYLFYYLPMLVYLKRQISIKSNDSVFNYITENEYNVKAVLNEVNRANAAWFKTLLLITKSGWDIQSAEQATFEHINNKYIADKIRRLESERIKLYRVLTKAGYGDQLIF